MHMDRMHAESGKLTVLDLSQWRLYDKS